MASIFYWPFINLGTHRLTVGLNHTTARHAEAD